MTNIHHKVLIGLGSNLGNRKKNLEKACTLIEEGNARIVKQSGIYESEPWGYSSAHPYYNQCIMIETELKEVQLFELLKSIELRMGRKKDWEKGYADRVIDLDILFFDGIVVVTERLTIPHPGIAKRRFVLLPLMEIASEMIHPVLSMSVSELYRACSDTARVDRLSFQ